MIVAGEGPDPAIGRVEDLTEHAPLERATGRDDTASEEQIRPTGTFDGSRAMEVAVLVRDRPHQRVLLDFSDVRGFEPFGVEVLLRELPRRGQEPQIRCSGVPPCLADALRELGIVVAPTEKAPRWAPWAWRSAERTLPAQAAGT